MIVEIAETALRMQRKNDSEIAETLSRFDGVITSSVRKTGNTVILLADNGNTLIVAADYEKKMPSGFGGQKTALPDGACVIAGACDAANAYALRQCFPALNPASPAGRRWVGVSGFGGATREAMPVFGMRSTDVVGNATAAVFAALAAGYDEPYALGALAKPGEVGHVLSAGATFVTLDATAAAAVAPRTDANGWCNRVFVLDAAHTVRIDPSIDAGLARLTGIVTAAAAAKRELRNRRAGFELLAGHLSEPEALYVLRELAKCNAVPDALAAVWAGDRAMFELIASVYGGECRLTGLEVEYDGTETIKPNLEKGE
ncbi:MAG: hypothetical protein PHI35_08065 [Victivallaceae bacterium]|nr:hypothetical protein [Victivallaceae bacterium]